MISISLLYYYYLTHSILEEHILGKKLHLNKIMIIQYALS